MPGRQINFINNEFYHVYNRSIDERRVFNTNLFCVRFYQLFLYYKFVEADLSFSLYKDLFHDNDVRPYKIFKENRVEILCYCFMPTHFHLLIKQVKDGGIVDFMSKTKNSFTKHYNIKHNRSGPLFTQKFNAVHIDNEELLLHVSRYIHLNPYSASIVKDINLLDQYKWSSYKSYVTKEEDKLINTKDILNFFENNKDEYKKFVMDRGGYQKSLEAIKHLRTL